VLKAQIKNALKIITPTKTVKKQLTTLYGQTYGEKIIPIYEGVDRSLQKAEANISLSKIFKQQYFLYVGNFYPHKNVEILIRAFRKIINKHKLILVGPNDYFAKRLFQLIHESHQDNRILFYHNATFEDLKFLYSHAEALIHPSLSEGFGLPLLEASYCNCPVIGSNIEVFKELLSEEYLSFDPRSEEDLINKIQQFLTKKMAFDYKHILSKYSFAEMTKKTLDVYASCL
jgi:glycosyltransferase involved in cell wall biosynthesis